jgi:hypothetical protein
VLSLRRTRSKTLSVTSVDLTRVSNESAISSYWSAQIPFHGPMPALLVGGISYVLGYVRATYWAYDVLVRTQEFGFQLILKSFCGVIDLRATYALQSQNLRR